jgi:uncharacterized Tic20 family protein
MSGLQLVWQWLVSLCGSVGAVLIALLVLGIMVGWLVTPVAVWLLYRRGRVLDRQVAELRTFQATLSRKQNVERLQRDRERSRHRRR